MLRDISQKEFPKYNRRLLYDRILYLAYRVALTSIGGGARPRGNPIPHNGNEYSW